MKQDSTLSNQIYETLMHDIISGVFSPTDIINENTLVERFGVSKSPVRDALIKLCNDGILTSMPRVGYRLVYYSNYWLDCIKEFRLCIELHYLDKYWERIGDEDIRKLEVLHAANQESNGEQADTAIASVTNHWLNNMNFHLAIAEALHDPHYCEVLQMTLKKLNVAYAQHYWSNWHDQKFPLDVSLHKGVIESIKANDKKSAIKFLRQDIDSFLVSA
ncbi:MAG: GntR family transcriptional regulator [Eubacteriales bacterium]|nr:GntR family transcriptional regulator [Eubacteriales bacterium]